MRIARLAGDQVSAYSLGEERVPQSDVVLAGPRQVAAVQRAQPAGQRGGREVDHRAQLGSGQRSIRAGQRDGDHPLVR